MIVGIAVCPAAPWLIGAVAPALAAGPAVAVAAVRRAAADLGARSDRILAVVPASRGSALGWIPEIAADLGPSPYGRSAGTGGPRDTTPAPLPGALWVARALLGPGPLDALVLPAEPPAAETPLPREVAAIVDDPARWGVLVLADGARCHGQDAPSAQDDRADDFERRLAAVLAVGDPAALGDWASAERDLGEALGATAAALLGVPAALVTDPEPFEVESRYLGAPYGVGYHLAGWRR